MCIREHIDGIPLRALLKHLSFFFVGARAHMHVYVPSATWVKTCFGGVYYSTSSELTTAMAMAPRRSRAYHADANALSPPSPADVTPITL